MPVSDISLPAKELESAIQKFSNWLQAVGYASHDPYDVWGTRYGLWARKLYYRKPLLGLPLIAPILLSEILCPQLPRLFIDKQRYATADAQLAMAFVNVFELTGDAEALKKAEGLAQDLIGYSVPGYQGYCWGYPFDWQHVGGLSPKNTPFITATPYCFESFLRLADVTGEQRYLDWAESTARFVYADLKDYPFSADSASAGYCPFHRSTVINASAYRAMVLFEASARFDLPEYFERASGNLRFILQTQRADGSWLYSADNPREAFIDHFHTCFVLKNLWKINLRLKDPAVKECIERGFKYYRSHLFDSNGLPQSFAIKPRTQLVQKEMYDFAEAITLGSLLGAEIPEAKTMARELAALVCHQFQLPSGHFITRLYRGGKAHKFPFLRWSQAQMFFSLTNLLKSISPRDAQSKQRESIVRAAA